MLFNLNTIFPMLVTLYFCIFYLFIFLFFGKRLSIQDVVVMRLEPAGHTIHLTRVSLGYSLVFYGPICTHESLTVGFRQRHIHYAGSKSVYTVQIVSGSVPRTSLQTCKLGCVRMCGGVCVGVSLPVYMCHSNKKLY